MHKRRQRHWCAYALAVSIGLLGAQGCSAAAQNDARSAATAFAGITATAQPMATEVARQVGGLEPANLGRLVGTVMGANFEVSITPPGAPNDRVTQASLNGTDLSGAFGRLDVPARRSFAGAGLQLARQA